MPKPNFRYKRKLPWNFPNFPEVSGIPPRIFPLRSSWPLFKNSRFCLEFLKIPVPGKILRNEENTHFLKMS